MVILNILGLTVALIFSTICFIGWFRAEKKLAKYNESNFFTKTRR